MNKNNNKLKIGILTYRFPPLIGRDADLSLSLFKNFNKLNIDTYIMTSSPNFFENINTYKNTQSLKINQNKIFKSNDILFFKFLRKYKIFRFIFRFFFFPDQFFSWIPFSIMKFVNFIKHKKITHVIVITPPISSLFVGYYLKKFTNIRLIIYIGDLWVHNPYLNLKRKYYYSIAKLFEKKIFKMADAILVASKSYIKILKQYNKISEEKLYYIPFGYDEELFEDIKPIKLDKFTILHSGTIYPGNYVNPIFLFKAIKILNTEHSNLKDKYQIIICGKYPDYVKKLVSSMKLENVILKGYLPLKKVLELMMSSHLNLILLYPKKENEIIIPSKIYDYMRAGNEILALVPKNGECAKLINDEHLGVIINPVEVIEIKNFLLDRIKTFINKNYTYENKINNNIIQKYERFNITKSILKIIKNL